MKQNFNILYLIGDWFEKNQLLWIFPNRKETQDEALFNTTCIILLVPLFVIIIAFRLCYLIISTIVPSFLNKSEDNSTQTNNSSIIVKALLFGVVLSILFYCPLHLLHNTAKYNNQSLFEVRNNYEYICPIENYLPNSSFKAFVFKSFFDACKEPHSSQSVIKMKRDLCIDDDFASNLHFKGPEGLTAFLYSLQGIDDEASVYLSEIDKIDSLEVLRDWYCSGTIEDFNNGDFYLADNKLNHYFNLYNNKLNFSLESKQINNYMHILRLLLQHKWALTTHREYAKKVMLTLHYFEYGNYPSYNDSIYEDSEYDSSRKEYEHNKYLINTSFEELSKRNEHLLNISKYFEGLFFFHQDNYDEAINSFEHCFSTTTDNILKQYCALMSIRTAFWKYDKERNQNNLEVFNSIKSKYFSIINLQYFISDVKRYDNIVKKIIADPAYNGY